MKKRMLLSSVFIFLFFATLCIRLGYIALSGNFAVSKGYNSFSLTLDNRDANLFYSDFSRFTNNNEHYLVVIKPTENCVAEIHGKFTLNDEQQIIEDLQKGRPVIKQISVNDKEKFIYCKTAKYYSSSYYSSQMFSSSSSGLLKYLDKSTLKINYGVDATGRMLSGDEGEIINGDYYKSDGLVLNIDKDIQRITYNACDSVKSGCAVVMDVNSSSVLACVTKPDNSYINKPVNLYSAGSIFKIVVALCAIENNIDLNYYCNGKIRVGDTEYSCQNNTKHKEQNLKSALANSCNCYFVNLALTLGNERLLKTVKELGFNETSEIYKDFVFKNASLPDDNELNTKGELALLGFGQGKLRISPLHFCNVLCTVANEGYYSSIKLIKGYVENGKLETLNYPESKKVIKTDYTDILLKDLRYVVSNGTAYSADYKNKSAGKTATAQTGQFIDGTEQYNTYFAGVYPFDNPKYAIVIMCENGSSGAYDCCPVFRTIVENIDKL